MFLSSPEQVDEICVQMLNILDQHPGLTPEELVRLTGEAMPTVPNDTVRYAFWVLLGRKVLVRGKDWVIRRVVAGPIS